MLIRFQSVRALTLLRFLPVCALALLAGRDATAETFIDIGIAASRVRSEIANRPDTIERSDESFHIGVGARRAINERSDFGVRLELDTVDSDLFLAIRAFDYRRHVSDRIAYSLFVGAARLELATPAYGYYLGAGIQIKDIVDSWDLGLDFRVGDEVARDNLLPSDPQGGSPDNFHNLDGVTLYLSRRF